MKFQIRFVILVFLLIIPIDPEEIKLKNGKSLKNVKIEKENEEYTIITTEDDLTIKIENSKIEKIEKSELTQKEKSPKPPEIVFTQFVANDIVVFGNSIYSEKLARRNNERYKNIPESYVLGSIVNFNTPIPGFKTNLIFANPIVGRNNTDSDFYYQSTPGGVNQSPSVANSIASETYNFDPLTVKPRKEKNGLKDFFIGQFYFEWKSKIGLLSTGFFIIDIITYPNNSNLGNYFISWKPKFLEFLNAELISYYRFTSEASGINQGNSHHRIGMGREFFKGNFFRISISSQAGYQYFNNNIDRRSGVTDITTKLQFNLGMFLIALIDTYKPNLYLFDNDRNYPKPAGVYPDNNANDGKITDPSKVHGPINDLVSNSINNLNMNNILKQSLLDYYQQQHMSRHLFTFNLGYTILF